MLPEISFTNFLVFVVHLPENFSQIYAGLLRLVKKKVRILANSGHQVELVVVEQNVGDRELGFGGISLLLNFCCCLCSGGDLA